MQVTLAAGRSFSIAALLIVGLPAALPAQTSVQLNDLQWDSEHLERALAQRGSLNVLDTPLTEVVEKLSTQFRVPIVLSPKKLEESGINVDTPVTKRLESLPLESILDILLDELELDFTIRNHVILITTPEHLESPEMLPIRIYPVWDLVARRMSGAKGEQGYEEDYDSLIDVITTTIAPEDWTDVGGPGSIREFENSGAIIVSASRRAHREIERLLASLRKVKEVQGIASLPLSRTAAVKPGSARIAGRTAANSARRAAATMAPAWQVPQVYAQ